MSNLDKYIGKETTIIGVAKNAKAGSIIITGENDVVYIEGLDSWSPYLINKRLSVIGMLKKEKYIPQATTDENGGVSTGATGDQYVLELIEYSEATNRY